MAQAGRSLANSSHSLVLQANADHGLEHVSVGWQISEEGP